MDVSSRGNYPANSLSNFAAHEFEIDGVKCASMEGFLQSLKHRDVEIQKHICSLIGIKAKKAGGSAWKKRQMLYWQGKEFMRSSPYYQKLLDRAYDALYRNSGFRNALYAAGPNAVFTHSVGQRNENETVLTTKEFCSRLMKLKDRLFTENA